MQDRKNFTYVKKASAKERGRLVNAVVFPVAIFFFSIVAISIFKNFGIKRESRLFSWFFCHEAAYLDEPNSLVVAFKSEAVKNRRY